MENVTREYVLLDSRELGLKAKFKESADVEGSILYGYRRFSMPLGKTLLTLERALQMTKTISKGTAHKRRGQAFAFILDCDQYLIYVDHNISPPSHSAPIPMYAVEIVHGDTLYSFEIATPDDDAGDFGRAGLYYILGDKARGAQVIRVCLIGAYHSRKNVFKGASSI